MEARNPIAMSREARIYRELREAYPNSMSAKQLMNRANLSWRTDLTRSFTLLCISVSRLNRHLANSGRSIERTGGTPDDSYSLRPSGG